MDGIQYVMLVRLKRDTRDSKRHLRFYTIAAETLVEIKAATSSITGALLKNSGQLGSRDRLLNVLHNFLAVNSPAPAQPSVLGRVGFNDQGFCDVPGFDGPAMTYLYYLVLPCM